jgi:hypothetical protein
MKAYQIKINGQKYSLPFVNNLECLRMLAKLKLESAVTVVIEEVKIKPGDAYRDGNTIFVDDFVRGCYYRDNEECI